MKLTRELILKWIRQNTNRPLKFSELAKSFNVSDPHRREFRTLLRELLTEGILVKVRGGRYSLPEKMNLVTGVLQGNAKGYGFLVPDDPSLEDIYIGARKMGEAMHLDRVIARVESQNHFERQEGKVIRVLERGRKFIVGVFESMGGQGWVIPSETKDFHDFFIPAKEKKKARSGQLVCIEITNYPTNYQPPNGKIVEILGDAGDPETEIRSIFRKYELSLEFTYEALQEVKRLSRTIDDKERQRRRDLTEWTIFTIDGEKAKDFDDAVSIEKTGRGYCLGVHIADVEHYIKEDSWLDREALERGTSVYYPEGVIPMLPLELSNDLCSLRPGVERLTMSVLIDFDEKGSILNHRIFKSIIRSCRRFTYNEAWQLLQSNQPNDGNKPTFAALKLMHKLSIILRKKRVLEGSVDFHIPEPEINVSDDGVVQDIFAAENNEAHKLIEEFMLAANQVVAKDLNSRKVPSIHRIHQPPDAIKLENLDTFLSTLGLSLRDPQNVKTSDLQRLVAHATGKPYERAINALILRAMKKAEYSSSNPGHFCLNFDHYSHFTSPIRRYPDLVVHRILKTFMHCEPSANLKKQFISRIKLWAKQSSLREQRAEKVEREIQNLRKAQFMSGKIGRKFNGLITSITAFGFFVELKEHFVEGLVHLSSMMDDYYLFIETEHKLKGRHSFKTFQIGDEVTVRVVNVNLPKRQIELNLSSA